LCEKKGGSEVGRRVALRERRREGDGCFREKEGGGEVCGPESRKGEKKEGKEGWEMFASKHEHSTRKHDLNKYQILHDS